jgi:DNA polymerase-4
MNRERFVLHLNVADFAVAVERVVDISLRDKAVIVAPLQAARATVYDMSDEAYSDGVRKGMLVRQAARLCRSACLLPPRFDLYQKAMSAFVNEARHYSPVLEPGIGDGHLFLDITGTHRLIGTAPDVGWQLRKRVRKNLGIDPIWTVGGNKLVTKVASRLVKPVGEYIVCPGEEESFLAPLPLLFLPGVQFRERARLEEFNIRQIGQLAALEKRQLYTVFGKRGETLYDISRGKDDRVVQPQEHQSPVICREYAIPGDSADRQFIEGVIAALSVRIGFALRDAGMVGKRLVLRLDYIDGGNSIRQISCRRGISDDFTLQSRCLILLKRAWGRRARIRHCRLTCEQLQRKSPQLSLFADQSDSDRKKEYVLTALDRVREKFGTDSVRFGSQVPLH